MSGGLGFEAGLCQQALDQKEVSVLDLSMPQSPPQKDGDQTATCPMVLGD